MSVLFLLDTGRATRVPHFVRGPVPAEPAALTGHYVGPDAFRPCIRAVRECLPAQWRKAFDRAGGHFWFDKWDNDAPASLSLRDARGKYLVTLYATPVHV